jgi:hypothetical protein
MTEHAELVHLFRALKAPAAGRALPALADRAREESWSYERFAEVLLGTEVSARDSHGVVSSDHSRGGRSAWRHPESRVQTYGLAVEHFVGDDGDHEICELVGAT